MESGECVVKGRARVRVVMGECRKVCLDIGECILEIGEALIQVRSFLLRIKGLAQNSVR